MRKAWALICLTVVAAVAFGWGVRSWNRASATTPAPTRASLPFYFEQNLGQTAQPVRFLTRGAGRTTFFTPDEFVVSLETAAGEPASVRMRLAGANPAPDVSGLDPLPGRSNYILGADPERWRSNIPQFAKLRYEQVYAGIDLLYYGRDGRLEYDFVVAPGVDPAVIGLRFSGADKLEVTPTGDLIVHIGQQRLRHHKPLAYHADAGKDDPIPARFVLSGPREVRFELGAHDPRRTLVIDPVLDYSTFVGGGGSDDDISLTVDAAGNAYVAAEVFSASFPTTPGAFDESHNGDNDIGLFKLSPSGDALVYSTFIGGSGAERGLTFGTAIAVDDEGRAYVVGRTESADFPTTAGAFDRSINGNFDGFVAVLDADGASLEYGSFFGGTGEDRCYSVVTDAAGSLYVSGWTLSGDLPTTPGAFDSSFGGNIDSFVFKLDPAGRGAADLIYATYLGGGGDDTGASLTIDSAGMVYVVGETESINFPTTPGAYDRTHNGGFGPNSDDSGDDIFVVKLDPNPAGGGVEDLLYGTFFGSSGEDDRDGKGTGVAVDEAGDIYFTGEVNPGSSPTTAFPVTAGAFDRSHNGGGDDLFLAGIRPAGAGRSDLIFATFLGGDGDDDDSALFRDELGFLYVSGETDSTNFPTVDPVQSRRRGGNEGVVAIFDPTGGSLVFSSYLGGAENEGDLSVAANRYWVFVAGETASGNFPTTPGAFDVTHAGNRDVFVTRIGDLDFKPEPPAPLDVITTVSGASFMPNAAPGSIVSGFAPALASRFVAAMSTPLPTDLDGTMFEVIDSVATTRVARQFFVSPTQANYFIDNATALGSATIRVLRAGVLSAQGTLEIRRVAPAFFTANATGTGVAAAFFARVLGSGGQERGVVFGGERPFVGTPIDLSPAGDLVFLELFGTGLRGGSQVTATVDGVDVAVLGVVALDAFVGLDQVNIGPLPRSLIGRGVVEIVLIVDGVPSPPVTVTIQ